ncbi:hypothetical protein [Neorhizobium sp. S3-V5DH]|uniref:hypothetical protein n=1 Tax=Neorhizobium sp. S3-V5DH TaxID=2485166 RepID=UPI00104BE6D4|nr:hypothetical protein [Neorhizobium sp. S3-V5DH]TCV62325.1 hypothetical protein EDE09_12490 [Neorhizobium sp. S3-V5DH]
MTLIRLTPEGDDLWPFEMDDRLAAIDGFMYAVGVERYWIAGGYFRDQEAGIPFKDIDVFIPGSDPLPNDGSCIRYDLASAAVATIAGAEVNFIRLFHAHTLETVLKRMDIGICQIGRDRVEGTVVTQAYLDDVTNRTLTLMTRPETEADFDHIKRVKAKFPEHKVVCAFP